jgi:hypothetical protein
VCVLTYIPQSDGRIAITHNRDEHILRPTAIPPQAYSIGNQEVTFPKDPQGGGTWFAHNDEWVVCLLNGAFEAHERKAQYRVSRGTVITEFFQNPDIQYFTSHFEPQGIEPFTMVLVHLTEKKLHQLIWDEQILHIRKLDASKPHIWSSSTLYNAKIKATRNIIFQQFAELKPTPLQIIDFHKTNIDNDLHKSFFVNINDTIKTVAITQIFSKKNKMKMRYLAF